MRKAFLILVLAVLNANAVDCVRATFDYFASQYMTDQLNLYILPSNMLPDSLHQRHHSQVYTIKYHWTGNHLDSMTFAQSCRDKGSEVTVVPDWKVDSTKVGKLKKYTWTFQPKYAFMNFTVYRGKDSVDIVTGSKDESTHQTFFIKNDTIRELNNGIPGNRIIYRDPKNENKCYRANGQERKFENGSVLKVGEEVYTTYEYETRGDFLIQKIFEPDRNRYVKPPRPCEGGDEYTTIYYRKKKK